MLKCSQQIKNIKLEKIHGHCVKISMIVLLESIDLSVKPSMYVILGLGQVCLAQSGQKFKVA